MQIQINWLLQKPTDLDLHCLLGQGMPCSAREGLTIKNLHWEINFWINILSHYSKGIIYEPHQGERCLQIIRAWPTTDQGLHWSRCSQESSATIEYTSAWPLTVVFNEYLTPNNSLIDSPESLKNCMQSTIGPRTSFATRLTEIRWGHLLSLLISMFPIQDS